MTATVPVGSGSTGVAITPNGARAYVTNMYTNSVSVIDTATNTVTDTVPVGEQPRGVAITPNGARAYVTNGYGNSVSVIDTATNTVTDTVPVGSAPNGVAITPNGARAYITNQSGASVSVLAIDGAPTTAPTLTGTPPRRGRRSALPPRLNSHRTTRPHRRRAPARSDPDPQRCAVRNPHHQWAIHVHRDRHQRSQPQRHAPHCPRRHRLFDTVDRVARQPRFLNPTG
ncbi:YncE family protein [Prescottella agglutinans]|uniref:YVTN family beta-propeller protein n=1 Tax=Prescottella agglutinans TaxID=1644129 RepID=A0ABT6MLU8_9NOCA|nr:YncE family protein [Prescottella agglutinans]MDH6284901.1 YVTN family beta-propeller protein [Prescottella agglutinans]